MQKKYKKNVRETSNDTYLSLRVQITINHLSICFLPQHQHQRKCFPSERELKKALRQREKRGMDSYSAAIVVKQRLLLLQ